MKNVFRNLLNTGALLLAFCLPFTGYGMKKDKQSIDKLLLLKSGEKLTWDNYKKLSEDQQSLALKEAKKLLCNLDTKKSKVVSCDKMSHVVFDKKEMQNLYYMAKNLVKKHKNTDFLFIGHSPALLAEFLRLLSDKKDGNSVYNISFSGYFLDVDEKKSFDDEYVYIPIKNKCSTLNFNKIDVSFKNAGLGIKELFKKSNRPLVVVDYIESGCGLASFLYGLFAYGLSKKLDYNNLLSRMSLVLLTCQDDENDNLKKIVISLTSQLELEFKKVLLLPITEQFVYKISKFSGLVSAQDRLVSSCNLCSDDNEIKNYSTSYVANLSLVKLYDTYEALNVKDSYLNSIW